MITDDIDLGDNCDIAKMQDFLKNMNHSHVIIVIVVAVGSSSILFYFCMHLAVGYEFISHFVHMLKYI